MTIITVLSSWMLSLALAFAQVGAPPIDRFAMLRPASAETGRVPAADGATCVRCHK